MIVVPLLIFVLGLPEKHAHATAILTILPISLSSAIVYIINGNVEYYSLGFVTIGFVVGGAVGALLLKKLNNKVIRIIFAIIVIIAGIKIIVWGCMDILWLIICGIAGGILGGMGMGGGTLLIPLLTVFLAIKQQYAQAINLIAFLPMSIVALIIHFKNNLVKYNIAIPISISGVLASVGGSFLASSINSKSLSFLFGIFLSIGGVFELLSLFIFKNRTCKEKNIQNKKQISDNKN